MFRTTSTYNNTNLNMNDSININLSYRLTNNNFSEIYHIITKLNNEDKKLYFSTKLNYDSIDDTLLYVFIFRCDDINLVINMIKLAIECGHDMNTVDENNTTYLHLAVERNNHELVKLLIDSGINVSIKNSFNKTALDYILDDEKFINNLKDNEPDKYNNMKNLYSNLSDIKQLLSVN